MKNTNVKNVIKNLQNFDPLAEAEKIVGESYKTNQDVASLGMLLQMDKSKKMEQLMDITDDTKFSETTSEYLRKVISFGFEIVYKEDFVADKHNEEFYMLWHKEFSILLVFDTFQGKRNGGHLYYNWSPKERNSKLTSSGRYVSLYMNLSDMREYPNPEKEPKWENESWEDYSKIQKAWRERDIAYVAANNLRRIWSGDHDCREAIKNTISMMVEHGDFLTKWVEKPYMWLHHHGDKKTGFGDEKAELRFNALPDYVKDCINSL